MAQYIYTTQNVDSGVTLTYTSLTLPDIIYLTTTGAPISNNITLELSGTLVAGLSCKVFIPLIDDNGYNIDIFGALANTPTPAAALGWVYTLYINDALNIVIEKTPLDFTDTTLISGLTIQQGTITLDRLTPITSGNIIVGNVGNEAVQVAMTGDVTITNAGVTAIGAGVITNADINAAAAIARTKIASGTASQVLINDVSGVMSSEAQLSALRGGNGLDNSAATGFPIWTAGVQAVGALTESQTFMVSFDAATELGDVKVLFPYACTVTGFYAAVTKTVEATNNATITPKNNAGTTLTSGALTLTAGTTIGTAFTSTPSANNTFTAGQVLTLTVAKVTAGGKCLLTVTYTRTS